MTVCLRVNVYVCVAGMTKVEEKLKAGRVKRQEGSGFSEEPQRRSTASQSSKKDSATTSSGEHTDQFFFKMSLFAHKSGELWGFVSFKNVSTVNMILELWSFLSNF